jgi:hypothetical protein
MAARPRSPEEEQFVRRFANALAHATAIAATDQNARAPASSILERIRAAYKAFRPDLHTQIRNRARTRLSGSLEERRRYFGDYADWTPETARAMDDSLRAHLKRAVRARVDAQRSEIEEFLSASGINKSLGKWGEPKTWLEAGYFSGEVVANWTKMTITSPVKIQFRWNTEETGAERGVWQLFWVAFGTEVLLDSGDAGDAPGPDIFSLDLAKYLSPKPPAVPIVLHVRVSPQTKMKILPGPLQGQVGAKVAGKAVGPPSAPVVITYSAISDPAPTFDVYELYRSLNIRFDKLHMVEDSSEIGAEQFWVMGFVQEFLPSGSGQSGKQVKFGPRYAKLDAEGPTWATFGDSYDFSLSNPDTQDWPRAYAIVVSALEEDDGGAFNDWHSQLGHLANEFLSGQIHSDITEYLQEQFEQYISDNWQEIVEQAPAVAEYIIALISDSTAGIVGMVIAVAAIIIVSIISDMGDDFYGIEAYTFALPTNIRDYIESLPGQQTNALLDGFRLETDPIPLHGHSSWYSAANYDGWVDLYFDCTLWQLETY